MRAPEAALAILAGFSAMRREGRTEARRMRDLAVGLADELAALISLEPMASPRERPAAPRAGMFSLESGQALLLGLPFGRCDAAQLEQAAAWSERFGTGALRLSFTRGLLLHGLTEADAHTLIDEASRLGFITDPTDPRLLVQACPGSPACASASTPTSGDALRLADAARALLAHGATVHVSGCPKGCAHPGAADLTLVGRDGGAYGVILNGSSRDAALIEGSIDHIMTRLSRVKNPQDLPRAFEETAP
jgi:precorrin-3B synthase